MWLITGPFDGELGNVTSTKTKLLKTGKKYPLGRKERLLLVNNKKISRDHCAFTVGEYTEANMADPNYVPRLEMYNSKEKAMSIDRGGEPVIVNPGMACALQSGDKIHIVVGILIEVRWLRLACVLPPVRNAPAISREHCASIGINLLPAPHPLATHHITPKYELTVPLATSLLSAAQLVRPEWLQEYLRLGNSEDNGNPVELTALEHAFSPPPEGRYRPAFSLSLTPALKFFKFWEPSEERLHFLRGYRFVLLAGKDGEPDSEARELALRGGGEYDGFPMAAGHARWRQMIAKAKRKKVEMGLNVVIVSNEQVIQATVGMSQWQEMVRDAQSLSVPIIDMEALVHAVVAINISHIRSASQVTLAGGPSPLSDTIPNGHLNEPSLPVVPDPAENEMAVDTRQPRAAEPKVASTSTSKSPTPSTAPPPFLRKKLVRPTCPIPTTSTPIQAATAPAGSDTQGPTPAFQAPSSARPKLKRRAATPVAPPSALDAVLSQTNTDTAQEPPLKKFKALFDASDPDAMRGDTTGSIAAAYDTAIGLSSGATTQSAGSATQKGPAPDTAPANVHAYRRGDGPGGLQAVAEDEEESLRNVSAQSQSQSVQSAPPGNQRAARPLALRQASQAESDSPAASTQGQDAGKDGRVRAEPVPKKPCGAVDTDPAFLTAVASRKRGKKGEDEFDREFNQLRISKPDLGRTHQEEEQEAQKEAWAVLGDFDDDVRNIRGNFMVVVEMDVYRESHPRRAAPVAQTCDGRPNFKKFKKRHALSYRAAPVELVIKAEDDYGVGSGYWKDDVAVPPNTMESQKRRPPTLFESDDEADRPEMPNKKQPPQRGGKAKAPRLFLESDEESAGGRSPRKRAMGRQTAMKVDDLHDGPAPAPAQSSNKKRHIIADDGSDDGTAFKGFGKKRRIR